MAARGNKFHRTKIKKLLFWHQEINSVRSFSFRFVSVALMHNCVATLHVTRCENLFQFWRDSISINGHDVHSSNCIYKEVFFFFLLVILWHRNWKREIERILFTFWTKQREWRKPNRRDKLLLTKLFWSCKFIHFHLYMAIGEWNEFLQSWHGHWSDWTKSLKTIIREMEKFVSERVRNINCTHSFGNTDMVTVNTAAASMWHYAALLIATVFFFSVTDYIFKIRLIRLSVLTPPFSSPHTNFNEKKKKTEKKTPKFIQIFVRAYIADLRTDTHTCVYSILSNVAHKIKQNETTKSTRSCFLIN